MEQIALNKILFRMAKVFLIGFLVVGLGVATPTGAALAAPSGKIVVVTGVDANTLDPHFQTTVNPEWNLKNQIFNGLVWMNDSMSIEPMLAESWKLIDDFTWEFKLRRGVKFHNGEIFNAESVKFSFERNMDPKLKTLDRTSGYIYLDRVEIVDDYTVRLITKKPSSSMIYRLNEFAMLPPKYYGKASKSEASRNPVGTGPFRFIEWVKDDHITLEANTDYWAGSPKIKTVIWRPIQEPGTRIAELLAGGADIISALTPDQAKGIKSDKASIIGVQSLRKMHLGIHVIPGTPLADKRVRQAINYGVDIETIGKTIWGGYAKRMSSPVHPPNNSPRLKPYYYDPEKAKRLLAEAGYEPGSFSATLDFGVGRYIKDKEVVMAIADYITKIGIPTKVRQMEWSTFKSRQMERTLKEFYFQGLGTFVDPTRECMMFIHAHVNNPGEWINKEYEDLYVKAATTMDEAKRMAMIYRMQEIAWDEAPWLFLYFQYNFYGVNNRLDWTPRPDERIRLTDASIVK